MKLVFKKVLEQITFSDIAKIVYHHYKGHEYEKSPKRSLDIKFEEFIDFLQKGGLNRRVYFPVSNKEFTEVEKLKGISNIEIYRKDFDWAKENISMEDHKDRVVEAELAGISDAMLGGDQNKIKMARDIMNNGAIKWKSDKIKALLREQFTDAEVHEIMNKREDMICNLSYISTIHKGLLDGTIK